MSALIRAIQNKRWRQARLLIEAGSDINWRGENNKTTLMEVCLLDDELKAFGLAKMLLQKGAKLNFQDANGLNALSYACLLKRNTLVDLFLEFIDYDLNAADKNENTALFHAITVGALSIVKTLVRKLKYYGLSVEITNSKGDTPLIHALKMGRTHCADVLIQEGKASLETRDMVHHKSAAQWKIELQRKGKPNVPPLFVENKQNNQNEQKSTRKVRKTVSATTTKSSLPRAITGEKTQFKNRPFTAPDRIPVSDFFKPCTPVQDDLPRLYAIYNQQTTSSYRKGYNTKPLTAKKLPALTEKISLEDYDETSLEYGSGKTKINFTKVKDLRTRLKRLHKAAGSSSQAEQPVAALNSELCSDDSQLVSEDIDSQTGIKKNFQAA